MSKAESRPKAEIRNRDSRPLYSHRLGLLAPTTSNDAANEESFWCNGAALLALRDEPTPTRPACLLERTAQFGELVIHFAKTVPRNIINDPLINQFVRAGTSVGANYCEADDPLSRKDYMKSIGICRKESKESKESKYWLQMIANAEPALKEAARPLW